MMNNKFIQLRGVCMYLGAIIQRLGSRSPLRETRKKISASCAAAMPMEGLSVAVKHTPGFASRRRRLAALLATIRQHHGPDVPVLVATESDFADSSATSSIGSNANGFYDRLLKDRLANKYVVLPRGAGLSAGRNALVRATRTPFIALMDDDMLLSNNQSLPLLLAALRVGEPEVAVAGGCQQDLARGTLDCFNLRFDASDGGSVVSARRTRVSARGCTRVHATHNFFVGRTAVLRRLGWDPRQRVMEHETFFYQLYLNGARVLACPEAVAAHDTRAEPSLPPASNGGSSSSATAATGSEGAADDYEQRSLRATSRGRDPGRAYMQYLCKNLPEVRRFRTPFTSWRCDTREFCTPLWDAQFPFDGEHCAAFPWDAGDDTSAVVRPLLAPYHNGGGDDVSLRGDGAFVRHGTRGRGSLVPLLALILTERGNVERRAWQRSTWLSFQWHALSQRDSRGGSVVRAGGDRLVPWRYLYATSASPQTATAYAAINGSVSISTGEIVGDVVTLAQSVEGARPTTARLSLGVAAVRWALSHVDFQSLLVTHDRSLTHVGRVWEWLITRSLAANSRLFAWGGATTGDAKGAATAAEGASTALPPLHQLLASGGSWLAGRAACKQLALSGHKTSAKDRVDVVTMPGLRRAGGGGATRLLRDQLIVDGVRHRPHEAFRALLQARGHAATWEHWK